MGKKTFLSPSIQQKTCLQFERECSGLTMNYKSRYNFFLQFLEDANFVSSILCRYKNSGYSQEIICSVIHKRIRHFPKISMSVRFYLRTLQLRKWFSRYNKVSKYAFATRAFIRSRCDSKHKALLRRKNAIVCKMQPACRNSPRTL